MYCVKNSSENQYFLTRNHPFNLQKVSWRYIKKIYVIPDKINEPPIRFRIFEPNGSDNEYVLFEHGYKRNIYGIRLISLLKYSGSTLKKETLINLLKTREGCLLVKQMIISHFNEVSYNMSSIEYNHLNADFYNFSDNREKWMRKNLVFQNTN